MKKKVPESGMNNLPRKPAGGSVHRIRQFELEKDFVLAEAFGRNCDSERETTNKALRLSARETWKRKINLRPFDPVRVDLNLNRVAETERTAETVCLTEEFDILQIVGEGWFGKILLAEHRATGTEMVLKALPKPYVSLEDFYREFHYGLHLGEHKNIITTYDVAFETPGFYVFSQEYAPLGDLTSNVSEFGIGEQHTKRVAKQLASALDYLHSKDLVHRDVKLDNILVFKSNFSRIKVCDFGETRRAGALVLRRNEWLPYAPPEVLATEIDELYKADKSHDVWQYAIVIFVCLTGCLPWQKASAEDPRYVRYCQWHGSNGVMMQVRRPKMFKLLSSKAQRMFRKYLEPRQAKRPQNLSELSRYLEDRWLARSPNDRSTAGSAEDDGLCPSMYSYHSSPEEKNKLLMTLAEYGIETTVDRVAKKDRIKQWIQNSIVEEEESEEVEGEEERIEKEALDKKRDELQRDRKVVEGISSLSRPDSTSR